MKIADTSAQDVALDLAPRRKRRRLLISGTVATLVAMGLMVLPAVKRWSEAEASVAQSRLRLAQVTRGDFTRDISVQGRVVAAVSPTLFAPQAGTITYLVDGGDQVKADQVLATIESPELENLLQLEQASQARLEVELARHRIQVKQEQLEQQKAVDLARLALRAAEREQRRALEAYERNAMSQIDFEKARDDMHSAEVSFRHVSADAELDAERTDFELRTRQLEFDRQTLLVGDLSRQVDGLGIRSPVVGMVGNLNAEQKAAVLKNQPVLSVVDLTQFEMEIQVPESYADDLALGMTAELTFGERTLVATLVSVSPEIENNQVLGRLRFNDGVPSGLRQNQRLNARILLDSRTDVLMVSRGQFLESGAGRVAYLVEDGMAHRRSIETGARSLNRVEILSGLEAGDTIVISSTELFRGADHAMLTD